jgi:uncharacterized protein YkwD
VSSGARQLTPQADNRGLHIHPARIAAACALACLVVLLPAPAEARKSHAGALMLQKINQARAKHGLRPLRLSPSLRRSSGRFARHLMTTDTFGHQSRVSASRRFRRLGEALAMHGGRRPGVRRTVRRWLASPSHRKLVLNRGMPWIGVGMARGHFGRRRTVIWVLQVGKL